MRKNRRITDHQYATIRVRRMRHTDVLAVRYLARDLRPAPVGGAR